MPVTILPRLQQDMTRYGMTSYLALGIVGNIFNCIIFRRYPCRGTPSAVYLVFLSASAITYLVWSTVPRIHTLNYPDPQTQSLFYCKVRLYGTHILGQYIRYAIVFACADRYFITRVSVRIRSMSSIPMAMKLISVMCVVSALIAIHVPILMDINNGVCGMFGVYKFIYAIYQTLVAGIIPPVLMSVFSILTIRSLHQRHQETQVRIRQRDRHLTRMVIAEVIANIVISIPYSLNLIYGASTYYVTNKSPQRLEIESFISFSVQFLLHVIGAAPFYLYIVTSKPFRKQFVSIFVDAYDKFLKREARVAPCSDHPVTARQDGRATHSIRH